MPPVALQGSNASPSAPALGADAVEVQLSCPASSFYAEDFYFGATLVGAYNETTLGECEGTQAAHNAGQMPRRLVALRHLLGAPRDAAACCVCSPAQPLKLLV